MPPPCVWEQLVARYSEPQRAYHTLRHLKECFGWFEQVRRIARQPGEIAFALFYHDAIYDTHAPGNEEQSADLAEDILTEYVRGDSEPARVRALILATKHDAQPMDQDAKLLVDIDLSILGSPSARFEEYERRIRSEYKWVAAEAFRNGRRRVLSQFLNRPSIYSCDYFRERLESTARSNLLWSLNRIDEID